MAKIKAKTVFGDSMSTVKHINVPLDVVIQYYAQRELKDFNRAQSCDILIDSGKRMASIEWIVVK